MKRRIDMTTGNPLKVMLLFTVPIIISQLLQQLYNTVDSIIIGKFIGESAFAAVTACTFIIQIILGLAIGAGAGCNIVMAKRFGSKHYSEYRSMFNTAIRVMLGTGIVIAVIAFFIRGGILRLLKTPEDIIEMSKLYLKWYCIGIPFSFAYNTLTASFNAAGDSRTPLVLLIISAVVNIALDLIFTVKLNMGVAGVAIATVIAQMAAAICAAIFYKRMNRDIPQDGESKAFDTKLLSEMLSYAGITVFQQELMYVTLCVTQTSINMHGTAAVAGIGAALKMDLYAVVPMVAIGNAVSTYTAQNIGAKKYDRIPTGLKYSSAIGIAMGVILGAVILIFKRPLMLLFLSESSGTNALSFAYRYLAFTTLFYWLMGGRYCSDGVLKSVGAMKGFVISNIIHFSIRIFGSGYLAPRFGIEWIWYTIAMGMGVAYILSLLIYAKGSWREKYGLAHKK